MTVDRYTKAVLTAIAACLMWLSLGGPSLLPTASRAKPGVVYLGGWVDSSGGTRPFRWLAAYHGQRLAWR